MNTTKIKQALNFRLGTAAKVHFSRLGGWVGAKFASVLIPGPSNYRRAISGGRVLVVWLCPFGARRWCTRRRVHVHNNNTLAPGHPPIRRRVFLSVNEKGEFYNVMIRIDTYVARCSLLLCSNVSKPNIRHPFYAPQPLLGALVRGVLRGRALLAKTLFCRRPRWALQN